MNLLGLNKMEEKENQPCIKGVIETAKNVLKTTGEHHLQFMGVDKDNKIFMGVLMVGTDKEKMISVECVRGLVKKHTIKKYWIVMEAWRTEIKKGEKLWRRAKVDIDRTECLMVSEFNIDLRTINVCIPFKRVDDKIVFEKEQISEESHSIWNVYLEKEGINERFNQSIGQVNDAFIRKISKEIADKYKDELFKESTGGGGMNVLMKMVKEGKQKIDDQEKTILEDPDKE